MRLNKLTAAAVKNASGPRLHNDGGGLYLKVTSTGSKSWVFRWRDRATGKLRDMGLGPYPQISLAAARRSRSSNDSDVVPWDALRCRQAIAAGLDPISERRDERQRWLAASRPQPTFDERAHEYIALNRHGWKNSKHSQQWQNTLRKYASPIIGDSPVAEVSFSQILRILKPIWLTKNETAARLRQRIEAVLDFAKVHGRRTGENPARWRGNLDKVLPKPTKIKEVKRHKSLHYHEVPKFMIELGDRAGTAARCLEFTILTAARTCESIGARWDEFDFENGIWTVPPSRIKSGREHRVPLSPAAKSILERQLGQDETFVFPSSRAGTHISSGAMHVLLRKWGKTFTVHGFRATFRSWVAECTHHPREIAEVALAHRVGNATEQAYQRGDLLEKRRQLMVDWEAHCF